MCAVKFEKERLILCEGTTDKTFFCELVRARGLPEFQVQFPYGAKETTGGVGSFARFLKGAVTLGFEKIVRGVLVVADNDDDPPAQFNLVLDQIREAGLGVPVRELEFARSPNGLPPVAVMMLPLNAAVGNLETVAMPAALSTWAALAPALDAFFRASPASGWASAGRQAKMKIQSLIAANCEPNPYATISTIYLQAAQYHLDLLVPELDELAQVLTDFDIRLAAAR